MKIELVDDLAIWNSGYEDGGLIVGSLKIDKYILIPKDFSASIRFVVEGLREGQSSDLIQSRLRTEQSTELDVDRFIDLLFYKGLCRRDGREFDGESKDPLSKNRDDLSALSKVIRIFNVRRNILRPEWLRGYPSFFFGFVAIIFIFAVLSAVLKYSANIAVAIADIDSFLRQPAMAVPGVVILSMVATFISFAIHEFGHVMMARAYGLYLRSIKLRLFMGFQFYISVQIPGLCTLHPRERASVALAGPLTNLLLACLAFICYFFPFYIPNAVRCLVAFVAAGNLSFFLGNCNPLLPTDGYHFISTVLFRHPDIKAAVIQRIQTKTLNRASVFEKVYLFVYILSLLFLLCASNLLVIAIISKIPLKLSLQWAKIALTVLAMVVISVFQIRALIRFLRGSSR